MFKELIYETVASVNNTIIYISIGCSMEHYPELTFENNQQYPNFLNKFEGNKVLLLFDPNLETPLKMESLFNMNNTLSTNNNYNTQKCRILNNSEVTVFAFNELFYYETNQHMSNELQQDTLENIILIKNIISICLNKINKTKIIVQDFTGRDLTTFYLDLFKDFNSNDLLNNVLFDVTQNNGGCIIDMNHDYAICDIHNNFIQEKYLTLKNLYTMHSTLLTKIINIRINYLNNSILWIYKKLLIGENFKDDMYIHMQYTQIKLLAYIYNINYDDLIENNNDSVKLYLLLIKIIIKDIIYAKQLDNDTYEFLIENINSYNDISLLQSRLSCLKI